MTPSEKTDLFVKHAKKICRRHGVSLRFLNKKYASTDGRDKVQGYFFEGDEDEKDYEDFADYIEKTRNFVEKFGFTFIKMTETFKIHMQHLGTNVHLSISSKGMSITTSV